MVKKHMKAADGMYHIHGHKYEMLEGSRAQVWHHNAHQTPGGLTRMHLIMNKHGRIVSKKKHATAKREKRLVKAGFLTKKGSFGYVKKAHTRKHKK
jgi:hypothetical protein